MVLPEWKIISQYGSQTRPLPPEAAGAPIAEVDAEGIVLHLNAPARQAWAWREGAPLPHRLHIALGELDRGHARRLPVGPGGQTAVCIRLESGRGWLITGDAPARPVPTEEGSSFRSLIEKVPVPVMRLGADGTVVYANAEMQRLTGYPSREMLGRPFWLECVHPEDRWKLMGAVRRAAAGEPVAAGLRFLRRDGTPRLAEMRLYPPAEREGPVEAVLFDLTERSELEDALLYSEALYRTFLEQSPVGLLHLDAAGMVTFENHPFRQITGAGADEAWIGRPIYEIPGLDGRLQPLLRQLLEAGAAFHSEPVRFEPGGEDAPVHLLVHGSPIRHPEGEIVGGVLMFEDVTQQHRRDAELLLRDRYGRAEASLRAAALSAPGEDAFLQETTRLMGEPAHADRVFVLTADAAGDAWETCAAWTPAPGAPPGIVVNRREHGLLERVERDRKLLHLHAADAAGPACALLDATGAGEAVWVPFFEEERLEGFVLFERTDGQPTGEAWAPGELHLIEQLVRLFETLRASLRAAARFRHIVAVIDDCLFYYTPAADGERRYLFATAQLAALTGYAPEELVARGPALCWHENIVHPADRAAVRAHDAALRAGRERRITYRIRHHDGSVRWLREHGTPQRSPGGGVIVSGILTDVTEQKEAEAVLLEARQKAEAANQLKSAFIATMSHEIRTPLGAVNGFAELLARELEEVEEHTRTPLPPQIAEFLQAIRDSSQKLLSLVNDLFDLSNLELGAVRMRQAPVPLHDVIRRSADRIAPVLAQKHIELRLDLDPFAPIVSADPYRLEQVLDNLLSNAAKFTDSGSVVVRTRQTAVAAPVEVIDTGLGMTPEYLERIFTPFLQEDSRLNRRFEGSGLGLALVKQLVELMGGRIEVESCKGEGSTFTVLLPRYAGVPAAPAVLANVA